MVIDKKWVEERLKTAFERSRWAADASRACS